MLKRVEPPPRRDIQVSLSVAILCAASTGFVVGAQTAKPMQLGPYAAYDLAQQLCDEEGFSVWSETDLTICGPREWSASGYPLRPDEMQAAPADAVWMQPHDGLADRTTTDLLGAP